MGLDAFDDSGKDAFIAGLDARSFDAGILITGAVRSLCGRADVLPRNNPCGFPRTIGNVVDFIPSSDIWSPAFASLQVTGLTSSKVLNCSNLGFDPGFEVYFYCNVSEGLFAYQNSNWLTLVYVLGSCDPCSCFGWTPGEPVEFIGS
jgi:hypothetical protein